MESFPDKIMVRCEKNGADVPHFTNGKIYEAVRLHPDRRLYRVIDDLGHERFIIPDEPSPHLVVLDPTIPGGQRVVGRFVTVTEEEAHG